MPLMPGSDPGYYICSKCGHKGNATYQVEGCNPVTETKCEKCKTPVKVRPICHKGPGSHGGANPHPFRK